MKACQLLFYPSFRLSLYSKRVDTIDSLIKLQLKSSGIASVSIMKVAKYLEKVNLMLERLKAHNLGLNSGVNRLID